MLKYIGISLVFLATVFSESFIIPLTMICVGALCIYIGGGFNDDY